MSRSLLMETLLGHMELLAERYPEKARLAVVKRARRAVEAALEEERLERERMTIAPTVPTVTAAKRSLRRAA